MIFERAGWRAVAILGIGALAAITATSCGGRADCGDGFDNDGDGLVDVDDPGCDANGDLEAPDPQYAACGDSVDNDGDGAIDLEDPGCADPSDEDEYNVPIAACRDGIDNDGDGRIDFPRDPGCMVSLDDDEADDCPGGASCPACADAEDGDGDGLTDYPDDLGCSSAADDDEYNADPTVCGASVALQPMPPGDVVDGFLESSPNALISGECGGAGSEAVFLLEVDRPTALVATTDFAETALDTVLYLRSECRESDTELSCNDDAGEGTASTLSIDHVDPGEYYLVVDSRTPGVSGAFRLQVDRYLAEGVACDPDDATFTCAAGLLCRLNTAGDTEETCRLPRCADDLDDDGDGKAGYPDDPGCDALDDNDEADDCPGGPGCPECGNGADDADPEDALVDYPDDLGCDSASDMSEQDCTDSDPVVVISGPVTTGDTSGATHDGDPSCTTNGDAPEIAHQLVVPGELASLSVTTNGTYDGSGEVFDTVVTIRQGECTGAPLACHDGLDDSVIDHSDVPAGVYFIFVDGWQTDDLGPYILNVSGVIKTGQPCNAGQVSAGLFSCQGGGACTGGVCQ